MRIFEKEDGSRGGFTLAELLIVVAIIAVLVAIAIPVFSKSLESSAEATDIANMRSAYGVGVEALLTDTEIDGEAFSSYTSENPLYFDGTSLTADKSAALLGSGTSLDAGTVYSACSDYTYPAGTDLRESAIIVFAQGNTVHVHWEGAASSTSQPTEQQTQAQADIQELIDRLTSWKSDSASWKAALDGSSNPYFTFKDTESSTGVAWVAYYKKSADEINWSQTNSTNGKTWANFTVDDAGNITSFNYVTPTYSISCQDLTASSPQWTYLTPGD